MGWIIVGFPVGVVGAIIVYGVCRDVRRWWDEVLWERAEERAQAVLNEHGRRQMEREKYLGLSDEEQAKVEAHSFGVLAKYADSIADSRLVPQYLKSVPEYDKWVESLPEVVS